MGTWSLRMLQFALHIALSRVAGAAGPIHLFAYEGKDVHVSCRYARGYESYEKYLCRNGCDYGDVLITTTGTNKSKYSIHDNKMNQVFTATISNLTGADAGKYWCGVSKNGRDLYTEVQLDVRQDTCCHQVSRYQSQEGGSVTFGCLYDAEHQSSLKYMCRGNQPSFCLQRAFITSDSQRDGQFSLSDDRAASRFTVTVTALMQQDSGLYLCGVQDGGLGVFSAVELDVEEWCCVTSHKLRCIEGHPLTLECPYPPQHRDNRKFFCRGEQRNDCTDMVTSHSRFTLHDNISSSTFLVTIAEVKAGDAGTYWCGSDSRWGVGNYSKIHLSTETDSLTGAPTSSEEPAGSADTPVVFVVAAVLLTLSFALLIVYRHKCGKAQEAAVSSKMEAADADEVMHMEDIYENQEVAANSKQGASRLVHDEHDGADDEEMYENFSTTDIYCNQTYVKTKR